MMLLFSKTVVERCATEDVSSDMERMKDGEEWSESESSEEMSMEVATDSRLFLVLRFNVGEQFLHRS